MTALIDTLFQIEKQLGLETDSLLPYADMDDLGGYHPDEALRKWWTGAIWEVEGKTLYAVMRALQPDTVVEIGSGTGCSASHICTALRDNGHGHMTTVDRGNTPQIPADLHEYVTMLPGDGIAYLALQPDNSIDFLLEDADHTTELCAAIGELAKTKLKPGGVLFVHDAAHWAVGAAVKAGYDLAGLDFRVYLTDPSDCGWLVWKKPETVIDRVTYNGIEFEISNDPSALKTHDGSFSPLIKDMGYSEPQPIVDMVIDTAVLQAQEEPNPAIVWTSDTHETFDDVKARHALETAEQQTNLEAINFAVLQAQENFVSEVNQQIQAQEEPNFSVSKIQDAIDAITEDREQVGVKWQPDAELNPQPPAEKKVKRTRKATKKQAS